MKKYNIAIIIISLFLALPITLAMIEYLSFNFEVKLPVKEIRLAEPLPEGVVIKKHINAGGIIERVEICNNTNATQTIMTEMPIDMEYVAEEIKRQIGK